VGSRYRAFVSYSHADESHARWLHQKLETYRLPRQVAHLAAAGERQGRIGPVFRDREELPAAQDLSEAVKEALAASDTLVVLCSLHARQSPWVAREIELFRAIAPGRPILAAILHGEPSEGFPEPLLAGGEPLAADLRKEGDGKRLGLLKIVAGITGVPLDALVQRDAQRKLRRVTAVTLLAGAAALAMAVMTFIAYQSRNEADRQRAEAEGLVEYMLTDLRGELRGVGRLDVMTGVNSRAMDYYESQGELDQLRADSLERRARVLHAMVEDETERESGNPILSERMAREALETTTRLLEADPTNAERIFNHAQSEYWLGRVFEIADNYPDARIWYEAYDASARRLGEVEPDSLRSDMERGFGALNLGIVNFRTAKDQKRVMEQFETAIAWFTRALERAPDDEFVQEELANAYAWLSNVHYNASEYEQALAAQQANAGFRRALAAARPQDRERQYDLLVARRALALTHIRLGRRLDAAADLRALAREAEALSASDPENRSWSEFADKALADVQEFN